MNEQAEQRPPNNRFDCTVQIEPILVNFCYSIFNNENLLINVPDNVDVF
jgi:hypothetical protein